MNVTVNLEGELYEAAVKKAVDSGKSFSAWLETLISKELDDVVVDGSMTVGEALGDDSVADIEWDLSRDKQPVSPADLE